MDDFLYICDDIYQRDEMLTMEISILQTLKFDINIPIAYHFLRRYARVRGKRRILILPLLGWSPPYPEWLLEW